ncbi:MAG: AAA family ATPase [Candidatus Poribacteria bacterium]|nr:AAA family ATPase [Candidatus Poribacteria bacterium]MDE0326902.1 AAA family ATPase [Candidatus Poribacteria bacterium]
MLKRIKIQGYKSLVDLEVNFEHLAVLVGPNASGKSNFLDALHLLSRVATSRTLKEAFDPPYRGHALESFTFGEEGIKSLLEQETVSFSIEVDVRLSSKIVENVNQQIQKMRPVPLDEDEVVPRRSPPTVRSQNLRYRIEIEILPKLGTLRVANEYLAALNTTGHLSQKRKPFLEPVGNQLHLRMEGQARPAHYERGLNYSILSMAHYPPHHPHLVAMRQELASWFTFYFEPRERMRLPSPVKEVHHIGLMGEDLAAFLNTLRGLNPRQFEAIEKSLHTMIPSITGIEVGVNALGEVELNLCEGEKRVSARGLSEGTLRILGFLALVGAEKSPALIGFEEPENGVHPRRIRRVARFLESRMLLEDIQFIVTTHSSLLPDLIPPESLYVCRKVNGNTEIEPFAMMHRGPLWKKSDIEVALDDEDALSPSERILRGDFDA